MANNVDNLLEFGVFTNQKNTVVRPPTPPPSPKPEILPQYAPQQSPSNLPPDMLPEQVATQHAAGAVKRVETRPSIECQQYSVNIGMDIKFEEDSFNLDTKGIITKTAYTAAMRQINIDLQACRATTLDKGLFFSGTAMLPLIPWAIRTKKREVKRRKIMLLGVDNFNRENPTLFMRWEVKPEKRLLIFLRKDVQE